VCSRETVHLKVCRADSFRWPIYHGECRAPEDRVTYLVFGKRNTSSPFIKNYDFDYPQTRSQYTVTAVAGHLMNQDFGSAFKSWNSCDPFSLFEASIEVTVAADKKDIEKNLQQEARRAQTLMIWTDCDREGEHIGYEVVTVCRRANARITVKRARFSAIIAP